MFEFGLPEGSLGLSDTPKGAYCSGICFAKKGATFCFASQVAAETDMIISPSSWVLGSTSWAVEEQD